MTVRWMICVAALCQKVEFIKQLFPGLEVVHLFCLQVNSKVKQLNMWRQKDYIKPTLRLPVLSCRVRAHWG